MSESVIFFKSKTCPMCQKAAPVFNEVIQQYKDSIEMVTVDIAEDSTKAIEHNVMSVPTVLFLKDGKESGRLSGTISKDKLERSIKELQGE